MAQSSLAFTRRLLTGVVVLAAAAPAFAESPVPEILSPLLATPIAPPNPVLGADRRRHLVYEIVLMDIGRGAQLRSRRSKLLGADGDAVLATLEGEALAKILRLTGSRQGNRIGGRWLGRPVHGCYLGRGRNGPARLEASISSCRKQNAEGKPSSGNDHDPTPQPPQTQSFIGAPLDVGRPAVVIAPPLKGQRWVVAGGCCDTIHLSSRRDAPDQWRDTCRGTLRH